MLVHPHKVPTSIKNPRNCLDIVVASSIITLSLMFLTSFSSSFFLSTNPNGPRDCRTQFSARMLASYQLSAALFANVLLSAFIRRVGSHVDFAFINIWYVLTTTHKCKCPFCVQKSHLLTPSYPFLSPHFRMRFSPVYSPPPSRRDRLG